MVVRFLSTFVALLLLSGPAAAQLNPLGGTAGGDQPLELESDRGLELHQDRQMIVARGNVVVRQGKVRLRADIVSASYKDINGKRSIHRVDALGGVIINTEKETLTGGHATYDLVRELFVLKGRNLRIDAEKQMVTAEDSLEYWGAEKRAVARGEATAIQKSDNTRIRADVIQAQMAPRDPGAKAVAAAASGGPEKLALNLVQAWGRVVVRTENEVVEGDKGSYDAVKRVATLEGNVVITRGKNQLRGGKAVVDLESGVSRLIAAPGTRVRSVFYPGTAGNAAPAAARPAKAVPAAVDTLEKDPGVSASPDPGKTDKPEKLERKASAAPASDAKQPVPDQPAATDSGSEAGKEAATKAGADKDTVPVPADAAPHAADIGQVGKEPALLQPAPAGDAILPRVRPAKAR